MSWTPKFSYQLPHERTCGIHVIAMITHLPYEYLLTVIKKHKGTNTEDLAYTLYSLGYEADRILTRYHGQKLPDLCIIHVQKHWCLYFKGKIYCSNNGVMTPKEYGRRIKSFLKVEIPNG